MLARPSNPGGPNSGASSKTTAGKSRRGEKIEREIEKKSDKENVDLLVRSIQDDLRRHTDDIKNLQSGMNEKMGVETMWKVVGLVLTVGGAVGGVVGFLVHVLTEK